MSRSHHAKPPYWHRCWWCDGHHRARCPNQGASERRRLVKRDIVEGVAEWLDSEPDGEPHPNCEVCGTVPDNRARLVKIDVPGGTVMHWSE